MEGGGTEYEMTYRRHEWRSVIRAEGTGVSAMSVVDRRGERGCEVP